MIWPPAARRQAGDASQIDVPSGSYWTQVRPLFVRYVSALVVVAVAIGLRIWLDPVLGEAGFAIILTGMLIAAWVGGLGPSLLGQTIILFAQAVWFNPEEKVHSPLTFEGIISLVAFYSVGGIVGILSEARQAARQKLQAQSADAIAQKERLRITLSCMGDGVIVTDGDARITLMNPAAERMTGWGLEECQGKSVLDVFAICDEGSQEPIENPVERVLREKQVLHETMRVILTTRLQHRLPVSYSAAPINAPGNDISGIVLIIRDETERRQSERALREADRRKDEFLATLAHELRNPLAPICSGLEYIKSAEGELDSPSEIMEMMDRQARHMVRLVDDLLDVSRITRGKLELRRQQVAIEEIVRNAVDATRPAIEAARHRLVVTVPEQTVHVYADPNRLTQVLSNLLDNAAKYTPDGGRIDLSAAIEDGELTLTVTDNGYGISADKVGEIFEMFMQIRSTMESGHKGLGIGLTLVKQLVSMHGGTVHVQSGGINRGSTFRVRLPASVPEDKSQDTRPRTSADSATCTSRRVLLVDDNADALKILALLVKKLGHDVYQARDGVEAVEQAEQVRPDIILMDIGMPRLNGYEAARQIREKPWGRAMRLYATTGWGQDEDRQRTAQAGFDGHLVKPVAMDQLQELLAAPAPPPAADPAAAPTRDEHLCTKNVAPLVGPMVEGDPASTTNGSFAKHNR